MINIKYLDYIPFEKRDEVYKSMVNDVYYFYYGLRPKTNEKIICINGNIYDLDKNNLALIPI